MPHDVPIAVVTPVRNGMPLLRDTIDSIRAQNYAPLEVAMVDDGSTDDTRSYLRSLNGFCAALERDGVGPAAARNAGIRETSAPWIAFLDADDLWPPGTLRALADALAARPDAGFAQGLIRNFRSRPDGSKEFFTVPYRYLNLGANLFRREVFDRVGFFGEDLRVCEDLDFLLRCWERDIRKSELDRVTLHYRRHEKNVTRGLSGAGFGMAKAYKRRIDRIRAGEYDASAPRHIDQISYIGLGPGNQDESYLELNGR